MCVLTSVRFILVCLRVILHCGNKSCCLAIIGHSSCMLFLCGKILVLLFISSVVLIIESHSTIVVDNDESENVVGNCCFSSVTAA